MSESRGGSAHSALQRENEKHNPARAPKIVAAISFFFLACFERESGLLGLEFAVGGS
jgi:hypothetical protein